MDGGQIMCRIDKLQKFESIAPHEVGFRQKKSTLVRFGLFNTDVMYLTQP